MSLSKKAVQAVENVVAVGITRDHEIVFRVASQSENTVRQVALTRYDYAGRRKTYHRCPACENGRLCYHIYLGAALVYLAKRPNHPFVQAYRAWKEGKGSLERCANILEMAVGREVLKWRHVPEEPKVGEIARDLTLEVVNRPGDWGREPVLELPDFILSLVHA
ncbi:MAG: hypothetical protein HPY90_11710 [Syntrophothermus sp.]|uniref:hypothetical protein n=1 Tax=Syntrophothermus sp. TaxID=2736299 RepID=UPI00257D67FB|nr:hypothetical protein [Syntrophothermus sp.]NSW83913.1 hypothetical protein [Syntrophothermus sp.]